MGERSEDSTTTTTTTAPPQQKPTITLPPRPSLDSFFATGGDCDGGGGGGGAFGLSPGPLTLMSSFFSADSEHKSFSQLLAGAMTSPTTNLFSGGFNFMDSNNEESSQTQQQVDNDKAKDGSGSGGGGFKMSRPMNLVVARSPLFTVPHGLSPSGLLNSPEFFSPQSPFGMSHQQALAQVTAQAVFAQSQMQMQAGYPQSAPAPVELLTNNSSSTPDGDSYQKSEPQNSMSELSEISISHSDRKYQTSVVDKPADDGYNWRKYGQKPIKGSEYPRSYYKCTLQSCPVKKKVERSCDGQISEIIYKGQHNHDKPQLNKRGRDSSDPNLNVISQAKTEVGLQYPAGRNFESHQLARVQSLESSDSEGAGHVETRKEDGNDDEQNPKRRNTTGASEGTPPKKTVTEPKIIVQTRSEVDLLDDGYRWRKYGQKVVKGNPHPRSYYKCTSAGCNVRKHVERASTDPKAVITTYEGKHNHGLPVARNSSHNTTSHNDAPQLAATQKMTAAAKHQLHKGMDFGNSDKRPVLLRLKEEQVKV